MARTKQTAKKSIPDNAGRKQLATKRAKSGLGKGKHLPPKQTLTPIKKKRPHKKGNFGSCSFLKILTP